MKGYRSAAHDLFCASSNFVVFDKPNRTNHKKLHKLTKLQNKRTIKTKILLNSVILDTKKGSRFMLDNIKYFLTIPMKER